MLRLPGYIRRKFERNWIKISRVIADLLKCVRRVSCNLKAVKIIINYSKQIYSNYITARNLRPFNFNLIKRVERLSFLGQL